MIALLALVTAVQEPDIVVIGRRFQSVEVQLVRDRQGKLHCSLDRSSGSLKLDERLCRASAKCVKQVGSDDAAVKQCITTQKPRLLATFKREMGGRR
ncbi:hypothetical protein [Sphingomonas xanthus]|uniref:Uncharacterized protein n=1 Tax=Sphingomonas xanthus TaxID=2594473 RepID=A0A516IRA1_9SPHN|nr:hypothetical protein [Sphingomonas xanthus]QDP19431.1 hypothetical protein FMM02_05310 [Sphingomonas xanthus]